MTRFVLYDGRAHFDADEASVMDIASTEEEARDTGSSIWKDHDAVWFEYDVAGDKLVNPRKRLDIPPGRRLTQTEKKAVAQVSSSARGRK
jgi:hypothetical protein